MSNGDDQMQQSNAQLPKGLAIAGMVCGILSLCLILVPIVGLILGIIGTACGAVGISKVNKGEGSGKGLAITGLVCGIVGMFYGFWYNYWLYIAASYINEAADIINSF